MGTIAVVLVLAAAAGRNETRLMEWNCARGSAAGQWALSCATRSAGESHLRVVGTETVEELVELPLVGATVLVTFSVEHAWLCQNRLPLGHPA